MSVTPQTTSRRTLAKGMAWSVPVIAAASAAPAFAVSPPKCTTRTWTSGTVSGRDSGYTTATYTTSGMTVTSKISSGVAVSYMSGTGQTFQSAKAGTNQNFVTYVAGQQKSAAQGVSTQVGQGSYFSVPTGTSNSALVLAQGTGTSTRGAVQTLTFTFTDPNITSVSFNLYDITQVATTSGLRYTDRVVISGATISSTSQGGSPTVAVSGNQLTGTAPSPVSGGNYITVNLTNLTGGNTFTLVYSNPNTKDTVNSTSNSTQNGQYIAIGDITACV